MRAMSTTHKPMSHMRLAEMARGARLDMSDAVSMAKELLAARTRIAMLEMDVEKLERQLRSKQP